MKMHNGVQLSDVEYEELLTLAEAADNGEDVMLTAFMRLCPTGQEGAFDESVVAAYAALADLGFIEGVQEGGEFFFEDITPAGRSLTNPSFTRNRGDESALFGEAASFDEPAAFDPRGYLGAGRALIQELVEDKIKNVIGSTDSMN